MPVEAAGGAVDERPGAQAGDVLDHPAARGDAHDLHTETDAQEGLVRRQCGFEPQAFALPAGHGQGFDLGMGRFAQNLGGDVVPAGQDNSVNAAQHRPAYRFRRQRQDDGHAARLDNGVAVAGQKPVAVPGATLIGFDKEVACDADYGYHE